MKLDSFHVQYVMDCMKDTLPPMSQYQKYLLAALYNAPTTINSYYSSWCSTIWTGTGQRGEAKCRRSNAGAVTLIVDGAKS